VGRRNSDERAGFEKTHKGVCAACLEAGGRFAEDHIGARAGRATRSVWHLGGCELPCRSRKIPCVELLEESEIAPTKRLSALKKEADELVAVIVTSINTAKRRSDRMSKRDPG
jgi:uncharacterized protein (DUF362 family)